MIQPQRLEVPEQDGAGRAARPGEHAPSGNDAASPLGPPGYHAALELTTGSLASVRKATLRWMTRRHLSRGRSAAVRMERARRSESWTSTLEVRRGGHPVYVSVSARSAEWLALRVVVRRWVCPSRLSASELRAGAFPEAFEPVSLVPYLCWAFEGRCDHLPVVARPRGVDRLGVDGLVEYLRSPKRTTPVLVVSCGWDGRYALRERDRLARDLMGLAHMWVLLEGAASRQLTYPIGREYACSGGDVRLYLPWEGERNAYRRDTTWGANWVAANRESVRRGLLRELSLWRQERSGGGS
jgi:hypothetical protein